MQEQVHQKELNSACVETGVTGSCVGDTASCVPRGDEVGGVCMHAGYDIIVEADTCPCSSAGKQPCTQWGLEACSGRKAEHDIGWFASGLSTGEGE